MKRSDSCNMTEIPTFISHYCEIQWEQNYFSTASLEAKRYWRKTDMPKQKLFPTRILYPTKPSVKGKHRLKTFLCITKSLKGITQERKQHRIQETQRKDEKSPQDNSE